MGAGRRERPQKAAETEADGTKTCKNKKPNKNGPPAAGSSMCNAMMTHGLEEGRGREEGRRRIRVYRVLHCTSPCVQAALVQRNNLQTFGAGPPQEHMMYHDGERSDEETIGPPAGDSSARWWLR